MAHTDINLETIERIAKVGSWQLDFSTGILVWSAEACRIYGLEEDDTQHTYKEWESYIHPDDLESVKSSLANSLHSWSNSSIQHRIVLKNGQTKELFLTFEYVFGEQGRATSVLGVAQDITEIVKTRTALRQSEDNLKLIFDLVPLSIYARRANGDYIFANQIFLNHYGINAEDLAGKNLKDLIKVPEELAELRRQDAEVLASNERLLVCEFKQKNSVGKTTYWRILKMPFVPVGETERAILGIAEDVTLERERVQNLVQYSETISTRNKQLEDFSFKISHDLRGPLSTIMNVMEVVDKIKLTNEELSLFVAGIRTSVTKMDDVIMALNEIVGLGRRKSDIDQ